MSMTSLFLADDHISLRDGLALMLEQTKEFKVTGRADNGKDTIAAFENGIKADVLILDINMPGMDGYETAKWMKKHRAEVPILIFSMYDTRLSLILLLQMGIRGVLKKDVLFEKLCEGIRAVGAGDYFYGEKATGALASFFEKDENGVSPMDKGMITDEEIAFIKLSATDMTYKEIAHELGLKNNAAEVLRQRVFDKLEVRSRVGLAVEAVKNGIVRF